MRRPIRKKQIINQNQETYLLTTKISNLQDKSSDATRDTLSCLHKQRIHQRKNVNINSIRNKFSGCKDFVFNGTDACLLFQEYRNKKSCDLTLHVNKRIPSKSTNI